MSSASGGAVGRPRRLDPESEQRRILDSALAVMKRNGYADASVADILEHAELSTRSFYRHFQSKDELLCAVYRRDAERAAERVDERTAQEKAPLDALLAWIDEVLSFWFDRRKAERVAVLGSEGARRAAGYEEATREGARLLTAPLIRVLQAGTADGSFPDARPELDARTIHAIALGITGQLGETGLAEEAARAQILRFVLPPLGVRTAI
ncbi:MAG: TetR/AcrR family transcriptional regulator [Acidimicrobiia bacterium]